MFPAMGERGKGAKPRSRKPSGTPRKRKGVKLRPTELGAAELTLAAPPPELAALAETVRADGGAVLAATASRSAATPCCSRRLPVDAVTPTPFQRDISDAHVRRLTLGDGQDEALPGPHHRGARAARR